MNVYTSFEIDVKGTENDFNTLCEWLDENCDVEIMCDDNRISIEESQKYGWIEAVTELAISMAKILKNSTYSMKGVIDTSETAGEYMNFDIEYVGGNITVKESLWYVMFYGEDYEDYEEFSEEFVDEDGEPRYTEEEFEEFCEAGEMFVLYSGEGDFVEQVPLLVSNIIYQNELDIYQDKVNLANEIASCYKKKGTAYRFFELCQKRMDELKTIHEELMKNE